MTTRDRLALIAISSLALLAVVWLLVVSPERKQAAELDKQVSAANAQLAGAEAEAANARAAQAHYADAYASVVDLGKAVPPSEEVPSLIYQLAQASNQKHLEFSSITTGATGASGAGASASSAATTAASTATPAGFTQMPFTFVFDGSFADLYHLFLQLDQSTVNTSSGLQVSGRLLTLQGVKLEPKETNGTSAALSGTITATAYVLPAGQGLTGGATSAAPATSAATTASSAAGSSTTSSAPPAAVATAGGVR
jgi:trimeric autotransporter adhesin